MGTAETVTTYRCELCGNKTRFDVYDTVSRRRFEHANFVGEITIEEEEIVERTVTKVVCRWCDTPDQVVEVPVNR
jgi:hypothetical protein